jgi:hypothetical protein
MQHTSDRGSIRHEHFCRLDIAAFVLSVSVQIKMKVFLDHQVQKTMCGHSWTTQCPLQHDFTVLKGMVIKAKMATQNQQRNGKQIYGILKIHMQCCFKWGVFPLCKYHFSVIMLFFTRAECRQKIFSTFSKLS